MLHPGRDPARLSQSQAEHVDVSHAPCLVLDKPETVTWRGEYKSRHWHHGLGRDSGHLGGEGLACPAYIRSNTLANRSGIGLLVARDRQDVLRGIVPWTPRGRVNNGRGGECAVGSQVLSRPLEPRKPACPQDSERYNVRSIQSNSTLWDETPQISIAVCAGALLQEDQTEEADTVHHSPHPSPLGNLPGEACGAGTRRQHCTCLGASFRSQRGLGACQDAGRPLGSTDGTLQSHAVPPCRVWQGLDFWVIAARSAETAAMAT